MPIYVYKCIDCKLEFESVESVENRNSVSCSFCGGLCDRMLDKQTFSVRPDIEPRYDISLGEHVGSRREYREKLAYNNAYSPDLFIGDTPTEGVLTKEERAELEGEKVLPAGTVFDKRQGENWGSNPLGSMDDDPNLAEGVAVFGEADYRTNINTIKKSHIAPSERRR